MRGLVFGLFYLVPLICVSEIGSKYVTVAKVTKHCPISFNLQKDVISWKCFEKAFKRNICVCVVKHYLKWQVPKGGLHRHMFESQNGGIFRKWPPSVWWKRNRILFEDPLHTRIRPTPQLEASYLELPGTSQGSQILFVSNISVCRCECAYMCACVYLCRHGTSEHLRKSFRHSLPHD